MAVAVVPQARAVVNGWGSGGGGELTTIVVRTVQQQVAGGSTGGGGPAVQTGANGSSAPKYCRDKIGQNAANKKCR